MARSENRLVVVSAGGQCPLELEVIASNAVLTLGEEGECVLERGLRWTEDIIAASLSIAELGNVSPTVERLGTLRPGYVPTCIETANPREFVLPIPTTPTDGCVAVGPGENVLSEFGRDDLDV